MKKSLKKASLILAAALASAPVMAEPLNYNVVEFNESATVTVPNDTMHITLTIREQAKTREVANNTVTRRLNAVQAKIRQNKQFIAELGSRHTYPRYNDKRQITNWEDQVQVRVKSTNFEALAQLASDVQADAMLDGVYFSVSPDKRAKAIEQASTQALQSFKQRAEFMSRSLGFSGYKLVKLDLGDSFESSPRMYAAPMAEMRMAKSVSAQSMDMSPEMAGDQEIRQTVRVSIQMQ